MRGIGKGGRENLTLVADIGVCLRRGGLKGAGRRPALTRLNYLGVGAGVVAVSPVRLVVRRIGALMGGSIIRLV